MPGMALVTHFSTLKKVLGLYATHNTCGPSWDRGIWPVTSIVVKRSWSPDHSTRSPPIIFNAAKLYHRAPLIAPEDYQKLHPIGTAPVITEDRDGAQNPFALAESAAVLEYLAQKHGNGRLVLSPVHPNYEDSIYWFHFANGSLQAAFVRSMYFSLLKLGSDSPWQQHIDHKLNVHLDQVNGRLETLKYLAGDDLTLADIMSVFSLSTMRVFIPVDYKDYPGIVRCLGDVGKLPSYQNAIKKAEPDLTPALDANPPALFRALAG